MLLRSIGSKINECGGFYRNFGTMGRIATPKTIFGSSRLKFWADLSDRSSLFKSTDTSSPVTALNDAIARVSDKSGNNNHATQATGANQSLWKQDGNGCYNALFDGVNDSWATSAIDFSAFTKMNVFIAVRPLSETAGVIVSSGNANTTNGAFEVLSRGWNSAASRYGAGLKANLLIRGDSPANFAVPRTDVLTWSFDTLGATAADKMAFRVNGVSQSLTITDAVEGFNFGNLALTIGIRTGGLIPSNIGLYQLFIVPGAVTAAEIAAAEAFLRSMSKAY